jgi:hypothetical protein
MRPRCPSYSEHASGQGEQDAISRADARLGHRTPQHNNLLAKDEILREEHGAGAQAGRQCAQDGLENFDERGGANRTTWGSLGYSSRKLGVG